MKTAPKVKIDPMVVNKEIMKAELRKEIIDKAQHIDTVTQELKAMEEKHRTEMNGLYEVLSDKHNELNLLKESSLKNFGIVFLSPERFEKYLH